MTRPGHLKRPRRIRRTTIGVVAVGVIALAGLLAVGWLSGWRTHTMTTPSMGRSAPVGSLVISRPVSAFDVHRGDILVFHPPGRPHVTFVHRVISITHTRGTPQFHTKGDINGAPDPWTLTAGNLIGRAALRIPDAGYLLQMLPLLLLGTFAILLLTHTTRREIKAPVRILTGSLLAAALILIYRPLVRMDLIGQVRSGTQGHAAVVPTGILPVRVSALHGSHVDLTPGQVGTVVSTLTHGGAFRLDAFVHLKAWWWLLLAVLGTPAYIALLCGRGRGSRQLKPVPGVAEAPPSRTRVQPVAFVCFDSPTSGLTIARPLADVIATLEATGSGPMVGHTLLRATLHADERGIQHTTQPVPRIITPRTGGHDNALQGDLRLPRLVLPGRHTAIGVETSYLDSGRTVVIGDRLPASDIVSESVSQGQKV